MATLPVVPEGSHHLESPYQGILHCCCLPRSQVHSGTAPLAPTIHRRGCSAYGVHLRGWCWLGHEANRFLPLLPTRQVQGECQGIGPSCAQPQDSAGRTHVQTPGLHRHPGCGKRGRGRGGSGGPRSSAPHSVSQLQMPGLEW